MRRPLLAVVAILTALLLQVDVVNRLRLPGGHPDLLLLVLVSLALVGGPAYGAVAGFAAGFAADTLPPTDHNTG
jgi:rod shape-determining protein MreD